MQGSHHQQPMIKQAEGGLPTLIAACEEVTTQLKELVFEQPQNKLELTWSSGEMKWRKKSIEYQSNPSQNYTHCAYERVGGEILYKYGFNQIDHYAAENTTAC